MFSAKILKISKFSDEIFICFLFLSFFTDVQNLCILHGQVFVMEMAGNVCVKNT